MDYADLFPFAPEVGYLSLTLVNFMGSLIPFVPLPGFLLLATMSVGDKFDLHVLALTSALAATAAKQIIFLVSYGGRRMIREDTRKRMRPFERLVKRYGAAAAFVAAATPIPDDLVYIPLGLAKYNPKRFFVATLAGKLVLSYVIVAVSHYLGLSLIEPYLAGIDSPTPIYVGMFVFAASVTVVIILLLRLDWRRVMGRFAPWTLDEGLDAEQEKPSDGTRDGGGVANAGGLRDGVDSPYALGGRDGTDRVDAGDRDNNNDNDGDAGRDDSKHSPDKNSTVYGDTDGGHNRDERDPRP